MKSLRRPMRSGMRTIVAGLVLCCAAQPLVAADRFVSTGGSDATNDCLAAASPCRTLGHALAQAASGDAVKLAVGRYEESTALVDSTTTLTLSGGWSADFATRDPVRAPSMLQGTGAEVGSLDLQAGAGDVIDVTLDGLVFTRNRGFYGAVRVWTLVDGAAHLSVVGSTITGNLAGQFGAYNYGATGGLSVYASGTSTVDLELTDSLISKNTGESGPIRLSAADASTVQVLLSRCVVERNRAFAGAGLNAVSTGGTLTVVLVDSALRRNKANLPALSPGRGGGLFATGGPTLVTLTNSIVSRNRANKGGGIVANGSARVELLNATVAHNIAPGRDTANDFGVGGGMHVDSDATVRLTNAILWKNKAYSARDLFMGNFGTLLVVDADHSDVGDRVILGGTFNDLGGNIDADPRTAGTDERLLAGSPAIDTGTCTGAPATDFEGDPRPTGAGCDMGADEFVP